MSTLKTDQRVMELLKLTDISRMIASTPLGPLMLQLRKGEREYKLILDSVPLEDELNRELMDLLFAKETIPKVTKSYDRFPALEASNEKSHLIIKVPPKKTPKGKNANAKAKKNS